MKLLLALALVFTGSEDGWVTWRVESTDHPGYWCCATWSAGKATPTTCELDSRGIRISSDHPVFEPSGEMQIYVKLEGGKARRIRTLSPQCPVEADGDINDLGTVATDDSLDWLIAQIGDDTRTASDALLAISAHAGPRAIETLVSAIENRAFARKVREEALFWLVNSGSDEAYEYLDRLLTAR